MSELSPFSLKSGMKNLSPATIRYREQPNFDSPNVVRQGCLTVVKRICPWVGLDQQAFVCCIALVLETSIPLGRL
jgi:hypothetical protein